MSNRIDVSVMIELRNKYVETSDKETLEAFLLECDRQKKCWLSGNTATDYSHMPLGLGRIVSVGQTGLLKDTFYRPLGYVKMTLKDLKDPKSNMKHIHSEMITRWANNPSLIVLRKIQNTKAWVKCKHQEYPKWGSRTEYFLVCEKHVEVALHWLNGGDLLVAPDNLFTLSHDVSFNNPSLFTNCRSYTIKPKTEKIKVWIGIRKEGSNEKVIGDVVLCKDAYETAHKDYIECFTWTEALVDKQVA